MNMLSDAYRLLHALRAERAAEVAADPTPATQVAVVSARPGSGQRRAVALRRLRARRFNRIVSNWVFFG